MRIYKATLISDEAGTHILWAGSKREMGAKLAELKRGLAASNERYYGEDVEALDVQPTKKGILRFLESFTPYLWND